MNKPKIKLCEHCKTKHLSKSRQTLARKSPYTAKVGGSKLVEERRLS